MNILLSWFFHLNLFSAAVLILIGFAMIWFSSKHVIKNSIGLAIKLNVSTFLIGSVIAALMTSLPEIVIALSSILQNSPDVSLGNIYGSNLSNMTIALAFPLLFIKKLQTNPDEQESLIFMVFISVLAMLSVLLPSWKHWQLAPLMIIAYFASIIALIKFNRLDTTELESATPHAEEDNSGLQMFGKLISSLVITTIAGNLIVYGSKTVSLYSGLAMHSIGAAFLTLASTIPEIMVNIAATKEGESGFVFGNSIGSLLGQSLLVLGFVYGFCGDANMAHLLYSVPWIGLISFALCFSLYFFKGLNRLAGAILALLYLGFWLQTLQLGFA